jgi:beta-mannosidase
MTEARVKVSAQIVGIELDGKYSVQVNCTDRVTKAVCCTKEYEISANRELMIETSLEDIELWNTWDRGIPYLYEIQVSILKNGRAVYSAVETTGFRRIEMVRDVEQTSILLNGEKWFVRGTSYFPDQYVSAMCEERYRIDLLAIKMAGFNLLRIHVHIEFPLFYQICDELGIGIFQDSEYNWTHPFNSDFADRFIAIFTENIKQLKHHPSIFVWICMNEPSAIDMVSSTSLEELQSASSEEDREKLMNEDLSSGIENCFAMKVYPGPKILEAVKKADPSRPLILGSFCANDSNSGDSHNYTGSLNGENTHYLDLYGTTEKLNTEYGFDAPPSVFSLKKTPEVYNRLKVLEDDIQKIQGYQYKYLKYVTEHYRLQKDNPCSGYIHFLFNDTSPISFYGIIDWWDCPKLA